MCRQNVINGEPELYQIGKLTDIDLSPIYEMMETYKGENDEDMLFFLEAAENEDERQKNLEQTRAEQRKSERKYR